MTNKKLWWYNAGAIVATIAAFSIGLVAFADYPDPDAPLTVGEYVIVDTNYVMKQVQRSVVRDLKVETETKDTTMVFENWGHWQLLEPSIASIVQDSALVKTAHGYVVVPLRVLKRPKRMLRPIA